MRDLLEKYLLDVELGMMKVVRTQYASTIIMNEDGVIKVQTDSNRLIKLLIRC